MVKPRHKRIAAIIGGVALVSIAAGLVLYAFRSNLVFSFTPTQVAAGEVPHGQAFRIGGLVEAGSLKRGPEALTVRFIVTDTVHSIPVAYSGILPDLFKEGKGVVAQGRVGPDGVFHANQVLAKHDENYMPPDAAHALEQAQKANKTLILSK